MRMHFKNNMIKISRVKISSQISKSSWSSLHTEVCRWSHREWSTAVVFTVCFKHAHTHVHSHVHPHVQPHTRSHAHTHTHVHIKNNLIKMVQVFYKCFFLHTILKMKTKIKTMQATH